MLQLPLFRYTASRFPVTGHFETSPQNDPKMTFNTKRSKVPHIHVTTIYFPDAAIFSRVVFFLGVFFQ